jgi:hypothetical protein
MFVIESSAHVSGDRNVHGRNMKRDLKEIGLDSAGPGYGPVTICCEHRNECDVSGSQGDECESERLLVCFRFVVS